MAHNHKKLAKKQAKAKAKAKARRMKASKPIYQPGHKFKLNTHTIPELGMECITFDVGTEFDKMKRIVTSEIIPYNTRSNHDDFWGKDWGTDGGYLIAMVPITKTPEGVGYGATITDAVQVSTVLGKFSPTEIDDKWAMITRFCSPDMAWEHFNEIADTLSYAFIGYSTTKHIMPLAENREYCLKLKG